MGGASYIDLPDKVRIKKACINPENQDVYCFKWSVRAYFLNKLVSNKYEGGIESSEALRHQLYRRLKNMNNEDALRVDESFNIVWNDVNGVELEFPMKLTDIRKFELANPSISINVFEIDPEDNCTITGPVHFCDKKKEHHINLIFIKNIKEDTNHYCWIKSKSRLISSQINQNRTKKHICDSCFAIFYSSEKLKIHEENHCLKVVCQFPKTSLKFDEYRKQIELPFIVVADSECILRPISSCSPNDDGSCKFTLHALLVFYCALYISHMIFTLLNQFFFFINKMS